MLVSGRKIIMINALKRTLFFLRNFLVRFSRWIKLYLLTLPVVRNEYCFWEG